MTAKTLLIGNGPCAQRIAAGIPALNSDLIVASPDDFSLSPDSVPAAVWKHAKVISCQGTPGDFKVTFERDGEKQVAAVDRIIIAGEETRVPQFSQYGLNPTERVVSLSGLKKRLGETPRDGSLDGIQSVVFLVGLKSESNPVIFAEVMQDCLELRTRYGLKVYLLTGNLKVAADGLEAMYRQTKEAGIVYVKFTATRPDIAQGDDGGLHVQFLDELTDLQFRLDPDLAVVEESIVPSDYTRDLVRIFKIDSDPNGFAQSDNVHRLPVSTNRRGIWVAGSSRGVQAVADQLVDADNALLSLRTVDGTPAEQNGDIACIDTGKCVRCLTCYRICPYRAIQVNSRVKVASDACEGCGICLAECPRGAIRFESGNESAGHGVFAVTDRMPDEQTFTPSVTAFCCRRSAARAAVLATCMPHPLPEGLQIVPVPCGGSVSLNQLMTAFSSGADGVMVLTCHEGNCHAEQGPDYARRRVAHMTTLFESIGLKSGRLAHKSLASNMGAEFASILSDFKNRLLELGPNRLKA